MVTICSEIERSDSVRRYAGLDRGGNAVRVAIGVKVWLGSDMSDASEGLKVNQYDYI